MNEILSHHAYLIQGRDPLQIRTLLKKAGIETEGNPDFHMIEVESLGVDDSRRISELSILKPFGERKIIFVHFDSATTEAQNALLKTLEDPVPHTHFVLLTPQAETLLPTLISRCERLHVDIKEIALELSPELFLKSSFSKRLEYIEKISKESDKGRAMLLVDGLEKYLYETKDMRLTDDEVLAFSEISRARKYIGQKGGSLKLILSHLALSIPMKF